MSDDTFETLKGLSADQMIEALKDPDSFISKAVARRLAEDSKFVVNSFRANHPIGDHLEMFVGLKFGSAVGSAGSLSSEVLKNVLDGVEQAKGPAKGDTIQ